MVATLLYHYSRHLFWHSHVKYLIILGKSCSTLQNEYFLISTNHPKSWTWKILKKIKPGFVLETKSLDFCLFIQIQLHVSDTNFLGYLTWNLPCAYGTVEARNTRWRTSSPRYPSQHYQDPYNLRQDNTTNSHHQKTQRLTTETCHPTNECVQSGWMRRRRWTSTGCRTYSTPSSNN